MLRKTFSLSVDSDDKLSYIIFNNGQFDSRLFSSHGLVNMRKYNETINSKSS